MPLIKYQRQNHCLMPLPKTIISSEFDQLPFSIFNFLQSMIFLLHSMSFTFCFHEVGSVESTPQGIQFHKFFEFDQWRCLYGSLKKNRAHKLAYCKSSCGFHCFETQEESMFECMSFNFFILFSSIILLCRSTEDVWGMSASFMDLDEKLLASSQQ